MIYLDYQATTPLAPEALDAMLPYLTTNFANPHSSHAMGRRAMAAVEVARMQLASVCPDNGDVTFTSGATEALNWAIKGSSGRIVTLATEHAAVLDTVEAERASGRGVTILPVGSDGLVDMAVAAKAITPETGLVVAMLVNNEIGVIQSVAGLGALARQAGALMLCDAVQGYGRFELPANVDMIAISAHKIHGPKGIGALWIRHGVEISSLMHGGRQEEAGRSGTLSPMLCAGFGCAAALMAATQVEDNAHVERLWSLAKARFGQEWQINGSAGHRYHGNLNIRRDGLDVARLMSDLRDIAFSAGSACASGSGRSSHVLRALGLSEAQARSSIRLGFGRYTSEAELTEAIDRIIAAADAQQNSGGSAA
ncbi:aminotransferase [Sphingomonas sp. HMWF008]|nr:aminotransferase [Sphingomonas sp. HMWF008]